MKSATIWSELVGETASGSSSEFVSSGSPDILRGSVPLTSSLGGDNARVRRSDGEEGNDREEIVEDEREKFRRGGENG